MLKFNLFCVHRAEKALFQPISADYAAGQIVQLVGPNGRGKTSMLRVLAGIYSGYEGTFQWLGNQMPVYLGHKTGLHPSMNLLENLQQLFKLYTLDFTLIDSILLKLGLMGYEATPVLRLSAGQTRKITLAPLFHPDLQHRPWLLDEPFTSLDQETCLLIESLCLDHALRGGFVMFTSHQNCLRQDIRDTMKILELEAPTQAVIEDYDDE